MAPLKENPEALLLKAVTDYPGKSVSALARITELPPRLVHGILHTLEGRGQVYIEQTLNPSFGTMSKLTYAIAAPEVISNDNT